MGRVVIAPGEKIRVLVVDDSVVIRRLVSQALAGVEGIETVGIASNGLIALERIAQLRPHVVTLDIEMPEMNGLEALKQIRTRFPDVVVIMFSTLTGPGASATLEALALGANDYITKASSTGVAGGCGIEQAIAALREELVPKIRQFFRAEELPPAPPPQMTVSAAISRPRERSVVAIGVSTGGPSALAEILPQFPAGFPAPILIVQHMPPLFTRLLAERLQRNSPLRIEEAQDGMPVEPGLVLIAPGDYHMRLRAKGLGFAVALDQGPPENSCRPAVDVLFRSVAECYGGAAVAAVLTGMGQDGLRGVQLLKARGAYILAQDEASSVVWGMPGYVARSGLADAILDLHRVVPAITHHWEARVGRA